MADLVIDPKTVAPIHVIEQITAPTGVSLTKGEAVIYDPTSGRLAKGNAGAAATADCIGIAISNTDQTAGVTTVVRKGYVNLGNALDALAFGAKIYLSNAAGKLADGPGTTNVIIGTVVPHYGATGTPDKVLRVNL